MSDILSHASLLITKSTLLMCAFLFLLPWRECFLYSRVIRSLHKVCVPLGGGTQSLWWVSGKFQCSGYYLPRLNGNLFFFGVLDVFIPLVDRFF